MKEDTDTSAHLYFIMLTGSGFLNLLFFFLTMLNSLFILKDSFFFFEENKRSCYNLLFIISSCTVASHKTNTCIPYSYQFIPIYFVPFSYLCKNQ